MSMDSFGPTVLSGAPMKDPGPVGFYARIGSPSPTDPNREQLVTTQPRNYMDAVTSGAKSALQFIVGFGNTNTAVAAQGVSALGEGVKAAGQGIKSAATSATSGIKIGVALVIVVIGIILIGYTRSALRTN